MRGGLRPQNGSLRNSQNNLISEEYGGLFFRGESAILSNKTPGFFMEADTIGFRTEICDSSLVLNCVFVENWLCFG